MSENYYMLEMRARQIVEQRQYEAKQERRWRQAVRELHRRARVAK